MRLSDIKRETKELTVDFGGPTLNIQYQVAGMSFAKIESMVEAAVEAARAAQSKDEDAGDDVVTAEATAERLRRVRKTMIGQLLESLVSWDLTEEDDETVMPITYETLSALDVEILKKIQAAITEDQKATGGK